MNKINAKAEWKKEGKDLMRAIAGGSLFGMPLLYTMEVWSKGVLLSNAHLLLLLGLALTINFFASLAWGVREDQSAFGAFADSVTAVGIAFVLSGTILALIGQLDFESELTGSIGKILVESIVVSVGITFVSYKFRDTEGDDQEIDENEVPESREEREELQWKDDLIDIGGSMSGALVFAFNVAPTEEILNIATEMSSMNLLILLFFEFLICYVILFASGLWQRRVLVEDSVFQKPWAETTMALAVALVICGGLIACVGFSESTTNVSTFLACTIVLALPGVVGAAGGRIAV